ncbi:MAG: YdcF family protein [Rhodoferax sp.]|nr:YdcF family protein [Rhodoferax sp.]
MFLASKLLSFATQPLAWVVFLLLTGLLCLPVRRKCGMGLGWAALIVLLLQGWEPLPDALLRRFETQHQGPVRGSNLQQYAGVVVLGGALEPAYVWQGHGQVALNDAAERMTVPIVLLQQYPHLRLLFTGGEGELFAGGLTEADRAKIFFDSMGVAPQRVVYESASHTTYENAVFSASVPGVNPAQPWLLLTSASHMPRALATFRKAGWNVTPYPVDFRTGTHTPWTQYSLAEGAKKWHLALHELFGLLTYRLAGRA